MFSKVHEPARFFESYSTSKKSKHSQGSHPIEFDSTLIPQTKNSPQRYSRTQNRHKHPAKLVYENFKESPPIKTEAEWSFDGNKKLKRQPYSAVPEIIYGTPKSDIDSIAILFQPDSNDFSTDYNSKITHSK